LKKVSIISVEHLNQVLKEALDWTGKERILDGILKEST